MFGPEPEGVWWYMKYTNGSGGQEYGFQSAVCQMILFIMSKQVANAFTFTPCYSVRLK